MNPSGDAIDGWLEVLWDHRATDLHLAAGAPPRMRVDSRLVPLEGEATLTATDTERLVAAILGDRAEQLGDHHEIDFSFDWRDRARFRGNAFRQRGHVSLALRMIPYAIPTPEDLGLPLVISRFLVAPAGLVIVTGPTGSGKSTTLAAMIDTVNRDRPCHIITLEDPIEYVHHHRVGLVNQREIGSDTASFHRGLRSALREDPDVVLVGEMRDLESISTTLSIAETGHLVFATLHTNDTAQAIDRIVDVFPAERQPQIQVQLASTLQGIVYQRLLPKENGGQVAAYEVLIANHAIRNLIREGRTRQVRNVVATSQSEGMQTFEHHLSALVADGTISYDVAVAASLYPKEITRPGTPAAASPMRVA